ncbi:MAG: type II toxin-antitoxin system RatA family toxin [Pseudomonadota bacterium]|nr:type II toxin-antitoxin system RatA family toxin [Pseudomonadota bacterium]
MKQVKKSVLLPYAAHEMYELVTDVEAYPQFLPWCERVDVVARDAGSVTARLHVRFAGIPHTFTTRNDQQLDSAVHVALVDGPFSELDGRWRFLPLELPGEGGATPACKIDFEMRYAFANSLLEATASPVFDRIADTFVDSFVRRAEQVHGVR